MVFAPADGLAQRRLAELAELIADERAAELTGSQRAIAESLSECAGRLRAAPPMKPAWGVSMAREPSAFMHRIGRLLQPERFSRGAPSWRVRAGAVRGALLVALLLPGFMVEADASKNGQSTTVLTDREGHLSVIKLSLTEQDYKLKIDGKGGFALNDDESDVVQMDDDAHLDIEENREGQRRRVRFEEDDGRIERSYWVDGSRVEFDATARQWLAEAFPRLMRETGINAEQRAARLFKRGGANGVLDEIDLIDGDYARRMYTAWLVEATQLDDRQFDRLIEAIGRTRSDYETRVALTAVSKHQDMSAERAARMLDAAGGIDSDYELRTLIEHLVGQTGVERIAAPRLVALAASLDSDYEMRVALTAMVNDGEFPEKNLPDVVATAGRMLGSDYELRTLLATTAEFIGANDELALAFVAATHNLGSDNERREALSSFAHRAAKGSAAWSNAIESASEISGDYECAEALITIAGHMPRSDRNLRLYRDALNGLSGYQRKRAARPIDDDIQL